MARIILHTYATDVVPQRLISRALQTLCVELAKANLPTAKSGSLKTEGAIPLTLLTKLLKIMKRYYVSVTEHLNKVVSVDAESENEAVQKVQDAYNNSDIILDADNFSGEVIEIEPDQEYWRESEEDDSVALQHID